MAKKYTHLKPNSKILKNPKKGAEILRAAEHIFAKKGFQAATISDIAKRAKVSEVTIYEYFSSKEELLFSIPAEIIRKYHEKNREILQYIQGAANKLRFLIKRHLGLYAENPDYANVVMLILKGNRNFLKTDAYKIVQSSIQPYIVRAMIWGTVEHSVTRKSLTGTPDDLLALADEIFHTIFKGIALQKIEPTINVNVNLEQTDS